MRTCGKACNLSAQELHRVEDHLPAATNSVSEARRNLLAERDQVVANMKELQAKSDALDTALASIDTLLGRSSAPAPARGRRGRPGPRRTVRRRREGTIGEAIETYLAQHGRQAIHANQILEQLESAGRAPSGKNPKATLGTTLRQLAERGRVRNIGKNRWRKIGKA